MAGGGAPLPRASCSRLPSGGTERKSARPLAPATATYRPSGTGNATTRSSIPSKSMTHEGGAGLSDAGPVATSAFAAGGDAAEEGAVAGDGAATPPDGAGGDASGERGARVVEANGETRSRRSGIRYGRDPFGKPRSK